MIRPLHIKNARIWTGQYPHPTEQRDLFTDSRGRITAERHPDALTVDLDGCTIFPGLVNAHDHLELNHYPRTKFREVYPNAHEWGDDVNARLNEPPYRELRAYPLWDRVFIGGLKNLLCGATTVIHHGPPHKPMFRRDFPVRVRREYGWVHSLHFSTDEEIVASYKATPSHVPWFIHLAEGTDDIAASEYQRLKALGCVGSNTVIVHGVGLTDADIADAAPVVRALVLCPTTNHHLLNADPPIEHWLQAGGQVLVGSDSRLTAQDDLLGEVKNLIARSFWKAGQAMHYANGHMGTYRRELEMQLQWTNATVTTTPADILGHMVVGRLQPGAYADAVILLNETASASSLLSHLPTPPTNRGDIPLILKDGVPQIGAPDLMDKFAHIETIHATLDGTPKAINIDLARQIARCALTEPGFTLEEQPRPRWFAVSL